MRFSLVRTGLLAALLVSASAAPTALAKSNTNAELLKNLRAFCDECSQGQDSRTCDKCERRRDKVRELGEKIAPELVEAVAEELRKDVKPRKAKSKDEEDEAGEPDEIGELLGYLERSRKPETVDALIKLLRSKGALALPSYAGQLDGTLKAITGAKPAGEKAYLQPAKLATAWESWWQTNRASWHPTPPAKQ